MVAKECLLSRCVTAMATKVVPCWKEASVLPHVDLSMCTYSFACICIDPFWKDTQKLVMLGVLAEGIGWLFFLHDSSFSVFNCGKIHITIKLTILTTF